MIWDNKIAVVVGATGGLGSALVKELDKEGVRCLLVSKTEEKLKELTKSLTQKDYRYAVVDFSDPNSLSDKLEKLTEGLDHIDFLFNAQGVGIYKGAEDISLEEWQGTINVNLTSPFVVIQKLMKYLKKADGAVVVNIGSGLGKEIYYTNRVAYIASKFGLRGLSLALSKDYQDDNIRFCYIALGSMLTNFGPGGIEERLKKQREGKKYFTPEWVANKLIELIKEDKMSDEITLYPGDYL